MPPRTSSRSTPSKRKPSSNKSSTPASSSATTPSSALSPDARPFPPAVGPGARPSLAPTAPTPKPLSYHLISGSLVLGTLFAASLTLHCIRLLLRPLFGAAGANQYAQVALIALCAPATLVPMLEPHLTLCIMGSTAALSPVVVYQVGRLVSRMDKVQELGPGAAAVLAQVLVVAPLAVCTVNLMKRWMPDRDYQLNGSIRAGFTTYAGLHSLGPIYSAMLPHTDLFSPCNILSFLAAFLAFMSLLAPDEDPHSLAAAAAAKEEKKNSSDGKLEGGRGKGKAEEGWTIWKLVMIGMPVLLMSVPRLAFTNPLGPGQIRLSNCAPIHYMEGDKVRILARTESVTGTLIVGESLEQGFRYLRCDSSLLGGQWLDGAEEVAGGRGMEREKESIFAAFELQQAVMLVDRPRAADDKALVIGLGIGTLPLSLSHHSLPPTILEIDPLVPLLARRFFGFPDLPTQLVEGRQWLYSRTQQLKNGTLAEGDSGWSVVVHDVFTGGQVPAHLFALEVFQELKALMKGDGVLGVNVVGEVGGNAGRAVWLTLLEAFGEGKCRAFHDSASLEPERLGREGMVNMLVLCTPAPALDLLPLPKGFTSSRTATEILSTLEQRELSGEQMIGQISKHLEKEDWVVREQKNYFEKWTGPDVGAHWQAMRQVMPAEVWEAY